MYPAWKVITTSDNLTAVPDEREDYETSSILSAAFVRTVNQPGRYGDGRGGYGLSLLVKPRSNGRLSKTWSQRVRLHGRVTNIGLGAYPIVSLSEARKKALQNRRTIEKVMAIIEIPQS